MRTTDAVGQYGEDLAARYLMDPRLRRSSSATGAARQGEIDIVAREDRTLVVCEVKTRRGLELRLSRSSRSPIASSASCVSWSVTGCGSTRCGPREVRIDIVAVLLPHGAHAERRPRQGRGLMPLAQAWSVALVGLEGHLVEIEADIAQGLPKTTLIGLPDASLSEARDRVRAAVVNSGEKFPDRKVTIGLSPATLPKTGSHYDVAIACALLAAAGVVENQRLRGLAIIGELGLDGRMREVRGALAMTLAASRSGFERVVVPELNAGEARLVPGIEVYGVRSLRQVLALLAADRDARRAAAPGRATADVGVAHPGSGGRSARRDRPAGGPQGDRSERRRWSSSVPARATRLRQDDARRTPGRTDAGSQHRRLPGGLGRPLAGRPADQRRRAGRAATVHRAAPHRVAAEPDRRRLRQCRGRERSAVPIAGFSSSTRHPRCIR